MRHQTESWLSGDWIALGAHIPHWAMVIAGLILVALLIAWFERPKRPAIRFSPRAAGDCQALPERAVSRPT